MSIAHEEPSVAWQLSGADRDQPAGRVFALVLDAHLAAFRSHEAGVRDDVDIEALHDLRVALRRARSVLGAGRDVYPAEELQLLEALSAQFASVTSGVRDFDVLIEGLPSRCSVLGARLRAGEDALTDVLQRRRDERYAVLVAEMDGELHAALVRRWQTMSNVYRVGGSEPGPAAHRSAGEVVDAALGDSMRRLRRSGRRAAGSDDLADWHRLRKRVKRFRYLLSSFEPMYSDDAFGWVQPRLAGLQDGLGELQDNAVLIDVLDSVGASTSGRAAMLAGALSDRLESESSDTAQRCRSAWERFDRPKLRRRLREAIASA